MLERMRLRGAPVLAAILAVVGGCGGGDPARNPQPGPTTRTPCQVGERPDYFVPGPNTDDPLAIIGCARLGASGKPVEFSARVEPIGRHAYLCVNPAYHGRGQLGVYIPTACSRTPVPEGVDVVGVGIPSQAVRRYQLVIWGTVEPSTRQVVARHRTGETAAAVFTARRQLAQSVGAVRPFGVFVVELARAAACRSILVGARSRSGWSTERIRSQPKLCEPR
jgi:hypothetical protein